MVNPIERAYPSTQEVIYQIAATFGLTLSQFFDSPLFHTLKLEDMKAGRSMKRN